MMQDKQSEAGMGAAAAAAVAPVAVNPAILTHMDARHYVQPSQFWQPTAAEAAKYGLSPQALAAFVDAAVRIRLDGDSLNFHVSDVMWLGGSKPVVSWFLAYFIPADASVADIKRKLKQLLQRRQFFAVCTACQEVKLRGYTDGSVCQGCAPAAHEHAVRTPE